jgi:hypothetical protein
MGFASAVGYDLPVFWQGAMFPDAPPGMPVLFKPL